MTQQVRNLNSPRLFKEKMNPKECDKPRLATWQSWIWQFLCGLCMGTADLVPGISGGTVAFLFTSAEGSTSMSVLSDMHVEDGHIFNPWIIACGAIAICAMLLPGISGSYLLVILGAYPVVIGALANFIKGLKAFSFNVE